MRIKQQSHDWRAVYEAFLASPAWRVKRERVLRRANSECEACLAAPATDVHHMQYPAVMTFDGLAAQACFQLKAMCRDCHAQWHGRTPPPVGYRSAK